MTLDEALRLDLDRFRFLLQWLDEERRREGEAIKQASKRGR